MKRMRFLEVLAGALLLFASAGCATYGRYAPMAQPMSGIEQYTVLEVEQVTLGPEVTSSVSDVALVEIREAFVKDFTKNKLFSQVVDTTQVTSGVLSLRTEVAGWNPGSGAARFLIGLGAAKLTLHVDLMDKAAGTKLGGTDVEFSYGGGSFGGGCDVGNMGRMMAPAVRKFIVKRGR
jgi:hypothetical protein